MIVLNSFYSTLSSVHSTIPDIMSKSTKDNKLRCTVCHQYFFSKLELQKHMKFSTGPCAQQSLITCRHCGNQFTTQKRLDYHIRMNPYCRVLEDPQKMSMVPFPRAQNNSQSKSQSDGTSASDLVVMQFSDQSSKRMRFEDCVRHPTKPMDNPNHHDKSSMFPVLKDSNAMSPTVTHQYTIDEIRSLSFSKRYKGSDCDLLNPVLERFCTHPDLRVSLNCQFLLCESTLKLSPKDKLILNVASTRTKFSSTAVCGTISLAVMDIMNNVALSLLQSKPSAELGTESSLKEVSRTDVTKFVMRFGIFWVPESVSLLSDAGLSESDTSEQASENVITIEDYIDLQDDSYVDNSEVDGVSVDSDLESIENEFEPAIDLITYEEEPEEEVEDAVDTVMCTYQSMIDNTRLKSMYNCNDIANLELYSMLNSSGAPAYLFDSIQEWAAKHGPKMFCGNGKKLERRQTFIKNMAMKVYGSKFSNQMKPKLKVLNLPSGNQIEVIVCPFRAQLISLLTNRSLMNPENLLIDPRNPFADVPDGILSELNTGWWYRETKAEVCTDPNKHILLPIVIFLDASNVDKNGRLQVNPMSFTLGIFKRKVRNLAEAWRTMGYIDDQLNYLDPDVRKDMNKSLKVQDVHAMLSLVMEDFRELQGKNGGFAWNLELDGRTFDVVFKLAIQVIIGDCKGNDLLCGRYGSHHINIKRLCRDCDVLSVMGDDSNHICRFVTKQDIENRSKEEINDLSFHWIKNAFSDVYFGARNLGITEVTPPEPLHGFRLGLCKYLFEGFQDQCPRKTMRLINFTVMKISKHSCRSSVRNLPDLQPFRRKGLTKCNTLSADEQYARLFGLYLTLLILKVLQSLAVTDRYEKQTVVDADGTEILRSTNIGPMGFNAAKKWLKLLSRTLTLNSWIMSPEHARLDLEVRQTRHVREHTLERESKAQKGIREYMKLYKDVVARTIGNGLCIPKYHQLLHYVRQILKDGSLLNIDGGRCESIATTNYTNPGKRTQMRQETFLNQLAHCHYADLTINCAFQNCRIPYGRLTHSESMMQHNDSPQSILGGSRFLLRLQQSEDQDQQPVVEFIWQGKAPEKGYPNELCSALARRLYINQRQINVVCPQTSVICYSEYQMGDKLFRAHPCYRSDGEWFDWAIIDWDEGREHVPAKLFMFIDLTECDFVVPSSTQHGNDDLLNHPDIQYLRKDKYVVIQTALEDFEDLEPNQRYRVDEKIARRIRLEQSWRIVPLQSIVGPTFVIPEAVEQNAPAVVDHVMVLPKSRWPDEFLMGIGS